MTESLLFLSFLTCKRRPITPAIFTYIVWYIHTYTQSSLRFPWSGRGSHSLTGSHLISEFRVHTHYIISIICSSLWQHSITKHTIPSAAKMSTYSPLVGYIMHINSPNLKLEKNVQFLELFGFWICRYRSVVFISGIRFKVLKLYVQTNYSMTS